MVDGGWKYYNYAMIPTTAPHEEVNLMPINDGTIWKTKSGYPIFARWTSDFDCGYETNWWYVIKDTPFDISQLKAKRRYEINKGKKNFNVKKIVATQYADEIIEVTREAYLSWSPKFRPSFEEEAFRESLKMWNNALIYGGFDKENNKLCAYAYLTVYPNHLEFNMLRVIPACEKQGINFAMVAAIVEDNNDKLGKIYINDGARTIRHETAFQDFLEKYFGFRKAYCRLHIKYRAPFGVLIKLIYPFRKRINRDSRVGSLISAVMMMEEISRNS